MAKRGDMIIISKVSRIAVQGAESYETASYEPYIVTSITRQGDVKAYVPIYDRAKERAHLIKNLGPHTLAVVPAAQFSIEDAIYEIMGKRASQETGYLPAYTSARTLLADLEPWHKACPEALIEVRRMAYDEELAEVRAQQCEHRNDEAGCARLYCNGVPPESVPTNMDVHAVPEAGSESATGGDDLGRAFTLAARSMLGDPSATMPAYGASGWYETWRKVRRRQAWTWAAAGHALTVVLYEALPSVGRATMTHAAVYVDGHMIAAGIEAWKKVDEVAWRVMRHVVTHLEATGWRYPDASSAPSESADASVPTPHEAHRAHLAAHQVVRADGSRVLAGDVIGEGVTFRSLTRAPGDGTSTNGKIEVRDASWSLSDGVRELYPSVFDLRVVPTDSALVRPDGPTDSDLPTGDTDTNGETMPTNPPTDAASDPDASATTQDAAATDPAPVGVAFTVDRGSLADALAFLVKVVPARTSAPVLSGVLVTVNGDTVRLTVTDGEQTRSVEVADASNTIDGRVLIPCKLFNDIVKSLPKRHVTSVRVTVEGVTAGIMAGGARVDLPTLPVEDVPDVSVAPVTVGTVEVRALADMVARVAPAASTDDTQPVLTCVHMAGAGGRLALTATNRYRAGIGEVAWSPVAGASVPAVVVPAKPLHEVTKLFARMAGKTGGNVAYGMADGLDMGGHAAPTVALTFGRYTYTVRSAAFGVYPPMRGLLPAAYAATATVEAAALVASVERARALVGAKTTVYVSFVSDRVTVTAYMDAEGGTASVSDSAPCAFTGHEGFTIKINNTYLTDGLAAVGGSVTFGFTDNREAVVLWAADESIDAPYAHLIMPIRPDAAPVDAGSGTTTKGLIMADTTTPKGKTSKSKARKAPAAPVTATETAPVAVAAPVDAETVERVAQAAYLAFQAGNYAEALDRIAEGERMAPDHLVAGKAPWSVIRATVTDAATLAPVPVEPTVEPVQPTRPADGVTITHGETGTLMVGTPYPLRFKVSALLNGKRGGLGWTFGKDVAARGAWVLDGSAGQAADSGKIRAAVEGLESLGLTVTVAVDGYDPDVAAASAPVVEPVEVPVDVVRDILAGASWSVETVRPRGGKAFAASVLKLPSGRLPYPVFQAVSAVVTSLGGIYQRSARGFSFASSDPIWNTNPVRYTASGEEKVGAWLAGNGATPASAPVAVTSASVPTPPAVVAATGGETPVNPYGLAVGDYARINGVDGHGAPVAVEGYVRHVAGTSAKGDRVRVSATPDGSARVVYVDASAKVEKVAPPAAVDTLTTAAIPASVRPAAADVAALEAARVAALEALTTSTPPPAAPAPVDADGALSFTLAAYSAEVGLSYRASRKLLCQALRAAGVRATVAVMPDNRRGFTVACAAADRERVAAIVADAVALDTVAAASR